jgi:hypothetical protein
MEATEPSFLSSHRYLSCIYLFRKDYLNYLSEARQTALLSHDEAMLTVTAAAEKGFAQGGSRAMLNGMLDAQKKLYAEGRLPAYHLAATCSRLGEKRAALEYLKAAYYKRESSILVLRIDPGVPKPTRGTRL